MTLGSMPKDGGNLILSSEEKSDLERAEPAAKRWVRRFMGSEEFIHNKERWCLWLVGIPPNELRQLPLVNSRVQKVREMRLASPAPSTRAGANFPAVFRQLNQPVGSYLIMPRVSSETRKYIPIGYMTPDVIVSDLVYSVPNATLFHFGLLASSMHNSWVRVVCGRLKSDYRYSNSIVYNNFPWPELPAPVIPANAGIQPFGSDQQKLDSGFRRNDEHGQKLRAAIETAAQSVLDARAQFPDATLADLYDPLTMPPVLVKAHATLDKAVDAAYIAAEKAAGRKPPKLGTDAERVAFLFERYQALTSLLPATKAKKPRAKKPPPA